jgi:hypothetical protein
MKSIKSLHLAFSTMIGCKQSFVILPNPKGEIGCVKK